MKRGLGLKVLEQDSLLAVGVGGGFVADAGLLRKTLWSREKGQENSYRYGPLDHVWPASGNSHQK
jgi:hypothetical protein